MKDSKAELLTPEQAYKCTFRFLQLHYEQNPNADLLLAIFSGMQLLADGNSADPAEMETWKEAVSDVLAEKVDVQLRLNPAEPEPVRRPMWNSDDFKASVLGYSSKLTPGDD